MDVVFVYGQPGLNPSGLKTTSHNGRNPPQYKYCP